MVDKEEEHPIYKPVTVKMMQPSVTGPTNFSVTPTQDTESQYMKTANGKQIVTSDELLDAKTITPLSNIDKISKDYAVQKTLDLLRASSHQDQYPQPVPIGQKLAKTQVQVIEPLYKPTPVVMIPQHSSSVISQPLLPPTPVVVQQTSAPVTVVVQAPQPVSPTAELEDPYLKQS